MSRTGDPAISIIDRGEEAMMASRLEWADLFYLLHSVELFGAGREVRTDFSISSRNPLTVSAGVKISLGNADSSFPLDRSPVLHLSV